VPSLFVLIILFLSSYNLAGQTDLLKLLSKSEQIILVVSDKWESTTATLTCYERNGTQFKKAGDDISVFLGKSGLGWGRGLINFDKSDGPTKKEGDKRSPAGVFSLPYVFGLLPSDSMKWLNYPYHQISKLDECVDDTSSDFYNKIVSTLETNKTWKSSENMDDPDYKYGIVISHNSSPVEKGCGSCIFFHLTGPKPKPTAGCTAMNEESLLKLLLWLDSKKNPLLIQLPKSEFEKIKHLL
jgi:D-alanyl-D-alanine dipeptidase